MNYPFISAKCITYGRVDTLEESIYSFINQDYPGQKEMIIVNDYPLQELVFDHPDVKIYNVSYTFDTIGAKENFATTLCNGDIICQWDDDDVALSNHLQNVAKYFKEESDLLHWHRGVFFNNNAITSITGLGNSGIVFSKKIWEQFLTLRADFYAHLAQYPDLRDAVAQHQEYIGPMTTEELRRAIEEPAKRGHWEFEPGLVDLILRDVGDQPGALPLLSHALLETWKRRAGHMLTLKGYADAGGVRGAIAHTAESVYQNLSPEDQVTARNLFIRLTELGEGTEDTRRRVSFDELMLSAEDVSHVRIVLNRLAEARLVTLGEATAEVAHEALIREWPTLRDWLNQDREGLHLHRHLTEAAREWALLGRDPGAVYRGAHLAQAREWSLLHPKDMNANERAFLEGSEALEQREQMEREEQQRCGT